MSSAINLDELGYDVLTTIFMLLNVVDLSSISLVCKSLRKASGDPRLWKKLDLKGMSSNFNIPKTPNSWSDGHSCVRLTQFLNNALYLSQGKINCLIFNYFVYLRDVHLISAAERTPNLKRLVLPGSGHLSESGAYHAMQFWRGLESITITSKFNLPHIFAAIGKFCNNLSEMKITCCFDEDLATAVVQHAPNLKVLSLQRMLVTLKALCNVLNSLEHLEVVNICHSLIVDRPIDNNAARSGILVYKVRELKDHLNASCLGKLMICEARSCTRCKNGNEIRGTQPYEFLETLWREDEISSLAH